jgi:hypothetical protein
MRMMRSDVPLVIATSWYGNAPAIAASGLLPVGITLTIPYGKCPFPIMPGRRIAPEWTWYHGPFPVDDFAGRYRSKLNRLGAELIRRYLRRLAEEASRPGVVLLGWADLGPTGAWCHRRIFADWWRTETAGEIAELDRVAADGPALFGGGVT